MDKILFIGSFLSRKRGTKSVAESLAEILRIEGLELYLISNYENKFLRIVEIFFIIFFYTGNKIHIDVFSGPAFYISEIASRIASFRGKYIILTLHGGRLAEFSDSCMPRIEMVFRRAKYIQTPSLFLQSYFQNKGFDVQYLPNGIDLSKFPFEKKNINSYSLLWIRAFDKIYNPQIAIQVLNRLKRRFPDCTLTMVGPDRGELASTKALAIQLGLKKSVVFSGSIPNEKLKEFFHQHTVYINTTSYESFGVAVVEAALCGIPIVSNSVGEIPYLWTHGENILLVNDNNLDEFELHISNLFNDSSILNTLATNARSVAEGFNWIHVKNKWVEILKA
jgi:glycosyltransferase involved in cell wall biosynthesis